jgi:hypothetical protein
MPVPLGGGDEAEAGNRGDSVVQGQGIAQGLGIGREHRARQWVGREEREQFQQRLRRRACRLGRLERVK